MNLRPFIIVAALCSLIACSAAAQTTYLALGNSVTLGFGDDQVCSLDPFRQCGYPGRLSDLMDCEGAGDCTVINAGQGGDKSFQAGPRLAVLLAEEEPDAVLIMYGINELGRPIEDIAADLDYLANLAEVAGAEAIHMSTIWRKNPRFVHDVKVAKLRNLIAKLAASRGRLFIDVWSRLCPAGLDEHGHDQDECFKLHYLPPPDPVGHPVASGYEMIAAAVHRALIDSSGQIQFSPASR